MGMVKAVMQKASKISASMESCRRRNLIPCFRLANIDSVGFSGTNRVPAGIRVNLHRTVRAVLTYAFPHPLAACHGKGGLARIAKTYRLDVAMVSRQEHAETCAQKAIQQLKDELLFLVDEDTAAFNRVMSAFALPKESAEEKTARSTAIQDATKQAAEVPLRVRWVRPAP